MARSNGSVDLSGWTICQDSESHQKRSNIFHEIIENQCLDQLRTIVERGWDVNEELTGYDPHEPLIYAINNSNSYVDILDNVQLLLNHGANPNVGHRLIIEKRRESISLYRPALYQAVMLRWTDLVEMLLEAGAKCTTSDSSENPLALALQTRDCRDQRALVELLLKHGADPNDHDDEAEHIPLVNAIKGSDQETIISNLQLLLKHGANPNVTYNEDIGEYDIVKWVQRTAVHGAASLGYTKEVKMLLDAGAEFVTSDVMQNPLALALTNWKSPPDLIELLIEYGADIDYVETADDGNVPHPLLHRLTRYTFHRRYMFLQQQLDLVFQHGGNINMEDDEHRTVLEYAVRHNAHSNNIRWLIRHGADTALRFTLLKDIFLQYGESRFSDTPLILLQAGMRVSHGVQKQLSNIEVAISTWLHNDSFITLQDMWDQLEKAEQEELQRVQYKKTTIPEYLTRQMVDLQEFSAESLQLYPKNTHTISQHDLRQEYQNMLDQVHRIQEFLSQPQSLQWYCRHCVRENLVSLQPSVVKKLPLPAILKPYILCHEI